MQSSFLLSLLSLLILYVGAYFSNAVVVPPLLPVSSVLLDHCQLNQCYEVVSAAEEHNGEGKEDGNYEG